MQPTRKHLLSFLVLISLLGVQFASVLPAGASSYTDLQTTKGRMALALTNLGYIGNAFSNRLRPSAEYPIGSKVEHVYRGGLWVGAMTPDGVLRVSTGAQDANGLTEGDDIREFTSDVFLDPQGNELDLGIWSNRQNNDNYKSWALATEHIEVAFNDYHVNQGGDHTPMGIKVIMRALVWADSYAADFVMLDYRIINISGNELQDVYVGLWVDTTVGSTELRDPYDSSAATRWDFNDDFNGAWGGRGFVDPAYTVDIDPDIWMVYERDNDGDEGLATSWIGNRLLGSNMVADPDPGVNPVTYNAWRFRGVPEKDTWFKEDDDPDSPLQPGKYQVMSNGDFTVDERQDIDYTVASNWVGLLSTGPFRTFAPDDTLQVTFALVAGVDSLDILDNSRVAQKAYNDGMQLPGGPPSPILEVGYQDEAVVLAWEPGSETDENGDPLAFDSPLRQPEHHLSDIDGAEDFQGYRIWRFQGDNINHMDPAEYQDRLDEIREFGIEKVNSQLVAEFDVVDGYGFDTGLPPLNEDGKREFIDGNLLSGFPYLYSVTSFSAPRPDQLLPAFDSGWGENSVQVYPGPAPAGPDNPRGVGVYPNPYRAGSMFDGRSSNTVEVDRRIWFTGLPARCTIRIFTVGGELVQTLPHDNPVQGQRQWDLLSSYGRVIASGMYIYSVEDLDTGEIQRGKLVIIK